MIPTVLILIFLTVFFSYGVYLMVGVYTKVNEPSEEQEREEYGKQLCEEGYAFDTFKVPVNAYNGLEKATPKKQVPGYTDLKSFSAVIFTQQHGEYLSTKVEAIAWGDGSIELVIVFPGALGDTVIEYFIVLNGGNELVSEGTTIYELPISLRKGDIFQIAQTLNLGGEDEKV